ncbi:DUF7351 domain-containing protein [Haladaptatus sp. GCM10025893]|uniref:DUF7351 domain-containing protein n=1 Tax=Haladaptatus sp. GCM10025893 TaxID=3252659 RepID=UPI00361D9B88
MNDSRADTRPDEAFALLGNETRVAILRELADASDTPLSFSALRERVGMRDSGQFNYHLGKLTGIFIDKVDAGYRLRYAGAHVMGAILAGAYEQAGTVGPFSLDDPCPVCGGTLEFSYEDERALVVCADCDRTTLQSSVPPASSTATTLTSIRWCTTAGFARRSGALSMGSVSRVRGGLSPRCCSTRRSSAQTTGWCDSPACGVMERST